ncbi:hypothetical protein CBR_g51790 [Chara braunii]|uniref:Uncharacterized protein n=1 Tax=Chara braunii TaxID=69332 RepID=A0A388M928_CHABU|nr:hypothetical protein CBR_g51790 [Chara braunii]|eukprot:GBG91056.1 hypothetical protein CBR_g51790 [Chara braunii]
MADRLHRRSPSVAPQLQDRPAADSVHLPHGTGCNADDDRHHNRSSTLRDVANAQGARVSFQAASECVTDLLHPPDNVKRRIEWIVKAETVEHMVGWLMLTVYGILLGSFGPEMDRCTLWMAVTILLVEAMLKLGRNFLHNYFIRGVPCSLIPMQLAEDEYHKLYLGAVWCLRVVGLLIQGPPGQEEGQRKPSPAASTGATVADRHAAGTGTIAGGRGAGPGGGSAGAGTVADGCGEGAGTVAGGRRADARKGERREAAAREGAAAAAATASGNQRPTFYGVAERGASAGEAGTAAAAAAGSEGGMRSAQASIELIRLTRVKSPLALTGGATEPDMVVGEMQGPSGEGAWSSGGTRGLSEDACDPTRDGEEEEAFADHALCGCNLDDPNEREAGQSDEDLPKLAGIPPPPLDSGTDGPAPAAAERRGPARLPRGRDQGAPRGGGAKEGADATPHASCEKEEQARLAKEQTRKEMTALVWYIHCKQHPSLPAVGAALRDGCSECGLTGNWFLSLEQLIVWAVSPLRKAAINASYPIWQSTPLNLAKEMALDALGQLVKAEDPDACRAIVDDDNFQKIVDIVGDHTSMNCRERAAAVIWHLANLKGGGPTNDKKGPRYDPLHSVSLSRLAKVAVALLRAVVGQPSSKLQENAMAALLHLSHYHGIKEFVFSGEEGKARIEQVYANYESLGSVKSFSDLSKLSTSRKSRRARRRCSPDIATRRHVTRDIEGSVQRLWIPPARACFRDSRPLPRLISLALSHGSSRDSKELIAFVLESYYALGAANLFPFEITELTRLLQVRYYTSPPELNYTAMLMCDLIWSYLYKGTTTSVVSASELIRYLVLDCGKMLYIDLIRLQLDSWGSAEFRAAREGRSARWHQFTVPFSKNANGCPNVERVLRAPARLMAYLLAHHYSLLRTEVEDVYEDDTQTRRSVDIYDEHGNKLYLAGTTVAASGLAGLIDKTEDTRTRRHACIALLRLASDTKVIPYVLEPCQRLFEHKRIETLGLQGWQPFDDLRQLSTLSAITPFEADRR